jgi:hypothetical protein
VSKPKPRRKAPGSSATPAPDFPRDMLAKPGEPGYWFQAEEYVGIRVSCRACGDPRRVGLLALYTFPEDDGTPWFEGRVSPGPEGTSVTLLCREGHHIRLRYDQFLPLLERMRDEVGPRGRRVVSEAL